MEEKYIIEIRENCREYMREKVIKRFCFLTQHEFNIYFAHLKQQELSIIPSNDTIYYAVCSKENFNVYNKQTSYIPLAKIYLSKETALKE